MKVKHYKTEEIIFAEKPTHRKFNDLQNKKFNKLFVIGYAGTKLIGCTHRHFWWCVCDCGNIVKIIAGSLKFSTAIYKRKPTMSCGCYYNDVMITHGMEGTSEYNSYLSAKARCTAKTNRKYKNYGGRGIKFLFNSFEEFYAELGDKPEPKNLYSVDRINNDGNYEVGNVRWATAKEQGRNHRFNRRITINNTTKTLIEWCEYFSINRSTVSTRLNTQGWCEECSLTIPVNNKKGDIKVCAHKSLK